MAEDKVEVLRAGCFFCHVRCGVLVTKVNGRITTSRAIRTARTTRVYTCSRLDKQRYLEGFVYNPNRLKKPLKRVGERGGGQWEEISWDQAFDEIAEKLADLRDKYGAETLAFTEGTARTWSWLHYKFTNLFGSPNTGGNGTICYSSDMWLEPCTYGGFCSDKSDWVNADLVVLWGRNTIASEPLLWDWVQTEPRGTRRQALCHRPALQRGGPAGRPVPADPSRHRCRAGARHDQRDHRGGPLRPRVR